MLTTSTWWCNVGGGNIVARWKTHSAERPRNMTTSTIALPTPSSPFTRRSVGRLAFLAVIALVALRTASERAMMAEFGSDPQMGIWIMFMVVKMALWGVGGLVLAGILVFAWHHRWGLRIALVLLFGWALAISAASGNYYRASLALADARDPGTSPARLQELLDFPGIQAGYELDNRLATNPQAPPELLRKLYDRHQLGTLMILARNPRTPTDILQKLVEHDVQDQWIRKGLLQNPSVPEELRQKIEEIELATKPANVR